MLLEKNSLVFERLISKDTPHLIQLFSFFDPSWTMQCRKTKPSNYRGKNNLRWNFSLVARCSLLFAHCSLHFSRCSLIFARCSLHFACFLLLFAHCSLLFARCLLLSARCSLRFARCLLLFARCLLLFARCSLLFARCLLLFARCSLLFTHCSTRNSEGLTKKFSILISAKSLICE